MLNISLVKELIERTERGDGKGTKLSKQKLSVVKIRFSRGRRTREGSIIYFVI